MTMTRPQSGPRSASRSSLGPGMCTVFLFSQEDHFEDRITCDGVPFGNLCEIWCGPRARSEKGPVLGMRHWTMVGGAVVGPDLGSCGTASVLSAL